jgi:hypothetical protein
LCAAAAADPHGPVFGNNGYRTEIRDEGAPDTDDFVGPLAAGETLSVSVRAAPGGGLLPGLALFDPAGADRTPVLREGRDGRAVAFRRFTADRTGRWVVRVLGRDDSEGAYEVRFRVGAPRGPRTRRSLLGGGAPRVAVLPFEAIGGSTLSLRLRGGARAGLPPYLEVIDPAGRSLPGTAGLLDRSGRSHVLRDLPLDGPDGTWRILAGVDEGPAGVSWRVAAPRRPTGVGDLDPSEPGLDGRASALGASPGSLVRFRGRGFSVAPLPAVLLDGGAVEVLSVAAGGESLSLILPSLPPGEPLEAVVVNPDGQACVAPGYLRVLPPGPPVVQAIEPSPVRTTAGSPRTVTLSLSGHAPPGGATVALSVEGCDATVPATVAVPAYGLEATFELLGGSVPGPGRLLATFGRTLEAPVEVLPLPGSSTVEIDLSGWKLVQTDSSRSFLLPPGTIVRRGGTVVVARNAGKAAFEAFWGIPLGPDVAYVDSGDRFPSMNGDETFSLVGPSGSVVDGPTPKLAAGRNLRRKPGAPAGSPSSWIDLPAAPGDATPGIPEQGVGDGAVRISEIADPSGSGQFVYEFLELTWDAP